ncbi:hypothetical protein ACFCXS_29405 [Streptomyces sp. NPDC056373]|uniref:hypothetical protein n=1 Tax=Streptomyces sp. NPDC056373 TaxID=3345798 RepID=UPI0035E37C4B
MPALQVRPFRRTDRDQLTDLVNLHVAALPERHARPAGIADIGNLYIDPAQSGTGVAHWLLARAADRLRLCGVDRLVACEPAADSAPPALLTGAGFGGLTRTDRGWEHRPGRTQMPGR